MGRHPIRTAAAVTLVVATPVATWGLMGRQDATGFEPAELDYLVRPFAVPEEAETAIGAVAAALAAGAALVLGRASRPGQPDRPDGRWWAVTGPLVAAGALTGAIWRTVTAGVVGANVGAGLAIMFGGPVVAGLVLWSLVRGLRSARARRRGPRPPRGGTGAAGRRSAAGQGT
ncbi:hypothetical protein [Actinacidiphila sp. bgisy167]|uniref:hypothetical protein n=1 Tax=Actinacidiphila sp. bgisy167 TaxID=3413797 RepID=UPI003D722B6F